MRGKHSKQNVKNAKLAVMVVALALVLCTVIGGTVAWLIADTDPVVNTFTYGDINISLEETDTGLDGDNDKNTNEYPMIPGHDLTKDPKVTVLAESEDAWLFVKLDKAGGCTVTDAAGASVTYDFDDFLTFEIADGWTALAGKDGVYYREVSKANADAEFDVIKNDTVTVKGEGVTKEMLNALDASGTATYPRLTVTAYAVQRDDNFQTAAAAWDAILADVNP